MIKHYTTLYIRLKLCQTSVAQEIITDIYRNRHTFQMKKFSKNLLQIPSNLCCVKSELKCLQIFTNIDTYFIYILKTCKNISQRCILHQSLSRTKSDEWFETLHKLHASISNMIKLSSHENEKFKHTRFFKQKRKKKRILKERPNESFDSRKRISGVELLCTKEEVSTSTAYADRKLYADGGRPAKARD